MVVESTAASRHDETKWEKQCILQPLLRRAAPPFPCCARDGALRPLSRGGAQLGDSGSGGIAPRTLAAAARKLVFSSAATVVAPSATVVAPLAANFVIRYKAVWLRPRMKDTHTQRPLSLPCAFAPHIP